MTTPTCDICDAPIVGEPAVRRTHEASFRLCRNCADWGYLASAFEPHRSARWQRARVFGARNASCWARGEQTAWERAGLSPHVPYFGR